MSINLRDIPNAVKFYLDNKVSISVTPPVTEGGTQINPNEAFTFSVKATNASDTTGGVKLKNVAYRVRVTNPALATFTVPVATEGSAKDDSGNTLAPNTQVGFMVFSPIGDRSILDIGETDALKLQAKAGPGASGGITTLGARIVADVDLESLFPTRENTPANSATLTVKG
jgi:hypothetical protein